VGRGVDVVLYLALVAGAYSAMAFFQRQRRIERVVTELVRQLALDRAERGADPQPSAN